jgi:enamine deaminase RidA (YjgF/YER057c/UK114 family)
MQVSGILAVMAAAVISMHGWLADQTPAVAQGKPATGPEQRLRDLKIELPAVSKPTNTLVNAVRVGDMLYVSGTGPGALDGKPIVGRLGQDFDVAKGQAAARRVGLQVLAVVKAELGSLDRVQRLVKTFGMVNGTADFKQQPQVINGFSDLMVEVFGEEAGKGARSAVGMASLPSGIPVEIEAIFQVRK